MSSEKTKSFVIKTFSIIAFLFGSFIAFMSLIDPEKVETSVTFYTILTVVISYLIALFLWKIAK
jgi:hypothetical protein